MSDILIRGMKMPKDIEPGLVIEFADGIDGKRYARLYHYRHGGLTEWLEAVPVPKHGRLIDADALIESLARMVPWAIIDPTENAFLDGLSAAYNAIKDAPTIIPAEEVE